jgi:hypothetical protein
VLQELDRNVLVVELSLLGPKAVEPRSAARSIERSPEDLNVLSTWEENPTIGNPTPTGCDLVLDTRSDPMPSVACRAIADRVPTAQWFPPGGPPGVTEQDCWLLAVPAIRFRRRHLVGIRRRRGYALRFNAHEVARTRMGLAS